MGNSCIGTHNIKFNVTENEEKIEYELIHNDKRDQFIKIRIDEKLIETCSNFD